MRNPQRPGDTRPERILEKVPGTDGPSRNSGGPGCRYSPAPPTRKADTIRNLRAGVVGVEGSIHCVIDAGKVVNNVNVVCGWGKGKSTRDCSSRGTIRKKVAHVSRRQR